MTVRAVYEDGVFKPSTPVDLPDHSEVELQIVSPQSGAAQVNSRQAVFEILSRRYRTGQADAAARHDEHQP